MSCHVCTLSVDRIVNRNSAGLVVRDAYPVSPGHTLVISHRHVGSFSEVTKVERAGLMAFLLDAQAQLDVEFAPASTSQGDHLVLQKNLLKQLGGLPIGQMGGPLGLKIYQIWSDALGERLAQRTHGEPRFSAVRYSKCLVAR